MDTSPEALQRYADDFRAKTEAELLLEASRKTIVFPVTTTPTVSETNDVFPIGVADKQELQKKRIIDKGYAEYITELEKLSQEGIRSGNISMVSGAENKRYEIPYIDFAMAFASASKKVAKSRPELPIMVTRQAIFYVRKDAPVTFIDLQPTMNALINESIDK